MDSNLWGGLTLENIDEFYRRRDELMNMPDEDWDDYLKRRAEEERREMEAHLYAKSLDTRTTGSSSSGSGVEVASAVPNTLSPASTDSRPHDGAETAVVDSRSLGAPLGVPIQNTPVDEPEYKSQKEHAKSISAAASHQTKPTPPTLFIPNGDHQLTSLTHKRKSSFELPEARHRKKVAHLAVVTTPGAPRQTSRISCSPMAIDCPTAEAVLLDENISFNEEDSRAVGVATVEIPQTQIPSKNLIQPRGLISKFPVQEGSVISSPSSNLSSPIEDASDLTSTPLIPQDVSMQHVVEAPAPPIGLHGAATKTAQHSAMRARDKVIQLAPRSTPVIVQAPPGAETSVVTTPGGSAGTNASCPSSPVLGALQPSTGSSSPIAGPSKGRKSKAAPPKKDKPKPKPKLKAKKEKPQLITPVDYVLQLQQKALEAAANPSGKKGPYKFLKGKVIYYVGGEMQYAGEITRGRMDYIVRYGGTLLPRYDPALATHIVTDAPRITTLRALGLKSLSDIPEHIPTVKWPWVVSGHGKRRKRTEGEDDGNESGGEVPMADVWMHAAFVERFEAGWTAPPKRSIKIKTKFRNLGGAAAAEAFGSADMSRISEFTQALPAANVLPAVALDAGPSGAPLSPPLSPIRDAFHAPQPIGGAREAGESADDPLAEFYARARAEQEMGLSEWTGAETEGTGAETDESDEEPAPAPAPRVKKGFTCDNKEAQRTTCLNQDVVDKLRELMELHKLKPTQDDRWRALSYSKAIKAIQNYPKRIKSLNEATQIRGIGQRTALKIMEILETGELRRIKHEQTADVEAMRVFQGIYGVGQNTALQWYASGCRTLEDVKARKGGIKVNPAQEIGIRYYDDLNTRMPRAEAETIFNLIKPIVVRLDSKLCVDIMGSFRRGKADCGDIDILITRPTDDGKTHAGIISHVLKALHDAGILTEDLSIPEDMDDLETCYRGLCRLPNQLVSRQRRIDILTVPWTSRGAALIYYTGDDIFNRAMRYKAGAMGYSLNQKGLFSGVVRDPRDRRIKLNSGTIVASETEEEIFRILRVPWQEPHERVRG